MMLHVKTDRQDAASRQPDDSPRRSLSAGLMASIAGAGILASALVGCSEQKSRLQSGSSEEKRGKMQDRKEEEKYRGLTGTVGFKAFCALPVPSPGSADGLIQELGLRVLRFFDDPKRNPGRAVARPTVFTDGTPERLLQVVDELAISLSKLPNFAGQLEWLGRLRNLETNYRLAIADNPGSRLNSALASITVRFFYEYDIHIPAQGVDQSAERLYVRSKSSEALIHEIIKEGEPYLRRVCGIEQPLAGERPPANPAESLALVRKVLKAFERSSVGDSSLHRRARSQLLALETALELHLSELKHDLTPALIAFCKDYVSKYEFDEALRVNPVVRR